MKVVKEYSEKYHDIDFKKYSYYTIFEGQVHRVTELAESPFGFFKCWIVSINGDKSGYINQDELTNLRRCPKDTDIVMVGFNNLEKVEPQPPEDEILVSELDKNMKGYILTSVDNSDWGFIAKSENMGFERHRPLEAYEIGCMTYLDILEGYEEMHYFKHLHEAYQFIAKQTKK